jgi:hypothetical protein
MAKFRNNRLFLFFATAAFFSVNAAISQAQDDLGACALLHQVLPSVHTGFAEWRGAERKDKSFDQFTFFDGKTTPVPSADCGMQVTNGDVSKASYACMYLHVPTFDRAQTLYHHTIDAVRSCHPAWTSTEAYMSDVGVTRTRWEQPDFFVDVFLDDLSDVIDKSFGKPETHNNYKVMITITPK